MFFTKMPKTEYDFLQTGRGTTIPNIFRQIRINDRRFDKVAAYEVYNVKDMRPDQVSYELYGTPDHYWTFFLINKHLQGGMNTWPKAYQTLEQQLNRDYPGYTIRPFRDANDDLDFNMVSSRFDIGDFIYIAGDNPDAPTGAYGILKSKDAKTNQLHFEYAADSNGTFTQGDNLRIGPYYVDQTAETNGTLESYDKYTLVPRRNAVHHFETPEGVMYTNYNNYLATDDIVTNDSYEKALNEERSKIKVIRKRYIDEFAIKYRQLVNG
jgi:hypothetical protein